MLINVGEAYIVVNILAGPLTNDSDIQESLMQSQKARNICLPSNFQHEMGDLDDGTTKLKLKIFGGPSAGEVYFFQFPLKQPIVIGRTPDCNVRINDKLLSKCQANVSYADQSDQWVMSDGFGGKQSTNGTWLYLNEDYQMHTGMVFKANQTIF